VHEFIREENVWTADVICSAGMAVCIKFVQCCWLI